MTQQSAKFHGCKFCRCREIAGRHPISQAINQSINLPPAYFADSQSQCPTTCIQGLPLLLSFLLFPSFLDLEVMKDVIGWRRCVAGDANFTITHNDWDWMVVVGRQRAALTRLLHCVVLFFTFFNSTARTNAHRNIRPLLISAATINRL